MKNFKQLLLSLLLVSGSFLLGNNPETPQSQEHPFKLREKASDHVIRMLATSKTYFRLSDDWKEKIQKNGADEGTISGMHGSFGPLAMPEKAVTRFALKNNDGIIAINSELQYQDYLTAETEEQEQRYKELAKNYGNEPLVLADDANEYTRCGSAIKVNFDEESRKLNYVLCSMCLTKMPCDILKTALESVKQREACFFVDQHEECFLVDVLP